MYAVTSEQKFLAIIAHIAYLFGGIGFIIAPLLIFLLKKDDDFVYYHAKQALVAHLAILVVSLAVYLLCLLLIGFLLLPLLAVVWLILIVTSLLAIFSAVNGELYQYPFIQNLVEKL